MFRHCKKYLTFHLMLSSTRDLNFSGNEWIYKRRHFFCFCLLLWNSQRLHRLRQLDGRAATRAATSRLLSGSDEDGKGRGKWTLRNKVAALLLLWWSKRKEKRRERTRKVRNNAVVCTLYMCLDVKIQGNCQKKSEAGVHFSVDVLSSWADQQGSCAHKCVC